MVRAKAAEALGRIGGSAVDILIHALKDADTTVRATVVDVLGSIRSRKAVEPLVQILKYDPDFVVQAKAAWSLGCIGGAAIEVLINTLSDTDSRVRMKIIDVIGKIGDKRAISPLIQMLRDESFEVRVKTAQVLEGIGREAVDPLIQVLNDPDTGVRIKASEVLGKIASNRATHSLIHLLKDTDSGVRASVAQALGRIRDLHALDPLIEISQDNESVVRAHVAEALGALEDARAVDSLAALLKDGNALVRSKAAEALGKIGDKKATLALIYALSDGDSIVRAKVVQALGIIGDSKDKEFSELVQCPSCKKQTRKEKARQNELSPMVSWIMLITGFILIPFLVGIPLVLYVSQNRMKKRPSWICEHCKHVFEINWYDDV